MQITRRQFLKYVSAAAATLGLGQAEVSKLAEVLAKDVSKYKVIWLAGQACTGCTMAFSDLISSPGDPVVDGADVGFLDDALRAVPFNWNYPDVDTLDDALLTVIDLEYHETLSAAAGDLGMDWLLGNWDHNTDLSNWIWPGGDPHPTSTYGVLIVEGAIPITGPDAWGRPTVGDRACTIGYNQHASSIEKEIPVRRAVQAVANKANAVISVGQCACYGGIPAAYSDSSITWSGTGKDPNGTKLCNAKGVQKAVETEVHLDFLKDQGGKLINVPGCPPHPDWIYGTIVRLVLTLEGTTGLLEQDSVGRPKAYYGETIHGPGGCPRYQDYNDGLLAKRLGDKGCLASIGCYGMSTHSDCAKRGWNNSRNNMTVDGKSYKTFCIQGGHPCISCTEPGYPFKINTNG